MPRASPNHIANLTVPIAPLSEQSAIVAFLDRETERIDMLVVKKRELIEQLNQQRTAIVSHAVTKGLKPDQPMKTSDVEWLGKVPAHWEVIKLKYLAMLQSGQSITAEDIRPQDEYPVYGGNGIRGYTNKFTHNGQYILIGRQGALCGNINYAEGRFWASEHAVVVYPRRPIAALWLGELLRVMNLNQYSVSAAQPGISVDRVAQLHIPVPPSAEQNIIANYLEHETDRIDTLVAKIEESIRLLRTQRTALISAAVTGKIDVRGQRQV